MFPVLTPTLQQTKTLFSIDHDNEASRNHQNHNLNSDNGLYPANTDLHKLKTIMQYAIMRCPTVYIRNGVLIQLDSGSEATVII